MDDPAFNSPDEAEAAFYDAFVQGDLAAMTAVWVQDEHAVCIHPMGPRLVGWPTVAESWRQILGAGGQMRVELAGLRKLRLGTLAVHTLHEDIHYREGETRRFTRIIATNVYVQRGPGWRMLAHHASPAPDSTPRSRPGTVH